MSIARRILPLAAIALLLASGCRSTRQAAQPAETATEAVTPPQPAKEYATAQFSCTTQGITANGQLRTLKDSVIWLSASKVIELGRAQFTPDSVTIYAKVMGRCFRGTYTDLYQRFHSRTSFAELWETVTAPDAGQQISDIAARFGLQATFSIGPWKQVDRLGFPMAVPANVNPL